MLIRPIRLIEIDTCERLDRALRDPVRQEDCTLFATSVPAYARRLAAAGLPCIYRETDGEAGIYGVDLVVCGDADDLCADNKLLLNVWKRHYHIPWTIARTERLWIRETVMEDLPAFLEIYGQERGNPDVKPFSDEPQRELEAYIRERYPFFGYGLWSVVERETGQVVGRVGFEEWAAGGDALQISCLIAGEARRKGYAKEAAQAALAYTKETYAPARVVLVTSRGNTASRRLAGSLGFRVAQSGEINLRNSLDKHVIYVYDV